MMMRQTRGQPLVALGVVLGCWVLVRVALWDAAAFPPSAVPAFDDRPSAPLIVAARDVALDEARGEPGQPGTSRLSAWPVAPPVRSAPLKSQWSPPPVPVQFDSAPVHEQMPRSADVPVGVAAAHQMLWMAVLSRLQLPMSVLAEPASTPFVPVAHESSRMRRWSGDSWLLMRRGGKAALAAGAAPSTYGASQMGAVVRYRIDSASERRPAAYLRATAALNGSREKEVAGGVSVRPFARVPVSASVELRVTDQPGTTRLRPAALAVTELPPFSLPLDVRGEVFAQAGYVGGAYATGFADGQLRVDRSVSRFGTSDLRAGAGVWGGAQKGASRLDVGPGAIMSVGLSESASARLAVDWRFRIAGHAAPSSGPALTLSAGF